MTDNKTTNDYSPQNMNSKVLNPNEILDLLVKTREVIAKCSKSTQKSEDIIELETYYNKFNNKYKDEQGLINVNKIMEDFVKGDKDCVEMYTYMEEYINIAKNQSKEGIVEKRDLKINNLLFNKPLGGPLEIDLDDITNNLEIIDEFTEEVKITNKKKIIERIV